MAPAARTCAAALVSLVAAQGPASAGGGYSGSISGVARILDLGVGLRSLERGGRTPDGKNCSAYVWADGGARIYAVVDTWNGTSRGADGRPERNDRQWRRLVTDRDDDHRLVTYGPGEIQVTTAPRSFSQKVMKIEFGDSRFSAASVRTIFVGDRVFGVWDSGLSCNIGESK